ncbi:MAG TPA: YraN family protein [Phycisphaerae bacterium]|nr:YraN family protein [Phycisphaerae bacterium]HRY68165.1 YraN family protein [Phycisphaerae bacterium]HSA27061.1 YraN family protein [Phycisphaerae bacterium]
MDDRAELGRAGERRAARFLRQLGYRLVARNYRCPLGEIDLVVLDRHIIVFVEVKTRTSDEYAAPEDAVTLEKQRRLSRSARFFIRQTRSGGRPCRFDVVAITLGDAGRMSVKHFKSAFVVQT